MDTAAQPRRLAGEIGPRRRIAAAGGHGAALAIACLTSYWLAADILPKAHPVFISDHLLGGLWSVIATVFVYRETHHESVSAALTRASGTLLSFALCLIYLLRFPFHPVGMAALIGLGTFLLMIAGRDDDIGIAGIATAVVMVSAALTQQASWKLPIMQLVDTAIGIAVGLGASSVALEVARRARGVSSKLGPRKGSRHAASPTDQHANDRGQVLGTDSGSAEATQGDSRRQPRQESNPGTSREGAQ